MDGRITDLAAAPEFLADTGAIVAVLATTNLFAPALTTQTFSGSKGGVGTGRPGGAIGRRIARGIITGWVVIGPATAPISAASPVLTRLVT